MNNKYVNFSTQYLITKALFMGIGFKILIELAGSYLWISTIIGIILGLFINYFISKIPHKFLTFICSSILLAVGLIMFVKMISIIYLNQTPYWVIITSLLFLIYYVGTKKEDTIFRVSSIIFLIELFLIILAYLLLASNIKINNFVPNVNFSIVKIGLASLLFALISTFPYMLLPHEKQAYNYKAYLLSSFSILIIIILLLGVLGREICLLYDYPEYMLYKSIHIIDYVENIENILFTTWIFTYFPFLTLAYSNIKSVIKS